MGRLTRSRVTQLERRRNVDGPPEGRLLFLIPDLWPEQDRRRFEETQDLDALGDLVERRTGVRPTFDMDRFWVITVPASEEMLAMTDEEKVAFLAAHESRLVAPDHWAWRAATVDGKKNRG